MAVLATTGDRREVIFMTTAGKRRIVVAKNIVVSFFSRSFELEFGQGIISQRNLFYFFRKFFATKINE